MEIIGYFLFLFSYCFTKIVQLNDIQFHFAQGAPRKEAIRK